MHTVHRKIDIPSPAYPIESISPEENILFFDIETTGFNAGSSKLYLIGCAYWQDNSWHTTQWFAEEYAEEKELLDSFFDFANKYTHIIHFNGNNFDIPYLLNKVETYKLHYNFDRLQGIDLYKRISPYKNFLQLPNCKQKTLEAFLETGREDTCDGGELINVYHEYVKSKNELLLGKLLLHNSDDLKGLIALLPILSYYDLFNAPLKAKKVQANSYTDYYGKKKQELIIRVSLPMPLPKPIQFSAKSCRFHGEEKTGTIRVPIYQEELKYFYANYKDYFYLPEEDMAIHKSVSGYMDKGFRTRATAENCYTRKYSIYLPEWDVLFQPFFKKSYKSKDLYFELTEDMKTNREVFSRYSEHILSILATQ